MAQYNTKIKNNKYIWCAIIIALFPILEPYAISESIGIMICDLTALFLTLYFLSKKSFVLYKPLFLLLLLDLGLTIMDAAFTVSNDLDILLGMKVFIAFILYLFAFSNMWDRIVAESFYKVSVIFGLVCAMLAITQFIFVHLGDVNFYSGRLPFAIGKYNAFGGLLDVNTGNLRVHSFFEEPSYLAIYELPITVYLLCNKKYVMALITGTATIITGSLIGVVGMFVIMVSLVFLDNSVEMKRKLQILLIWFILIIGIYVLYLQNGYVGELVNYYIGRFLSIDRDFQYFSESSAAQRILGNVELFYKYDLFNSLFGMGINQYPLYFNLPKDYSNDFVTSLLNYGYVGLLAFLAFMVNVLRSEKPGYKIYFIIFLMVLAVDHAWFGALFFYLLTWCILGMRSYPKIKFILGA